jgi:8-oxo-dGTP diphosphatase
MRDRIGIVSVTPRWSAAGAIPERAIFGRMLVQDARGNQLLEISAVEEDALTSIAPLTHALVLVRRRNGDHLLVYDRYKNHWELPGGAMEPGETARDCAVRELMEESGIVVAGEALRFRGVMKFFLQRSRRFPDPHIEYGALYETEQERIPPFAPNDEIAKLTWWDGSANIGEVAAIDAAIIELCRRGAM